ncbi:16S rRNA (guanine(1207)-N(2))-methyltransferase RsmC [Apirhabdus apintestini]|uniref:16S rRNA (guanine(1207)-N(2))-methyltransferase RsmC n=1 Tax=Erwinia sp. HR93 TaxID=3094840 RepID=UPI002ADED0F9|nr:16S rRNA (guanine(1207)-N(2))-methyltransferase RsmC [Erwinia sp. HR93]MEA1063499.1 16S rRNA (guanine(1207)-N(2))-methyltransferase RsmC [Erwinia sp. HR93]WPM85326.1 16S rRNA (guanine(1207)-N(2))-methyltransferase RsmC [Enterobacteriaceae bacterium CA-0114]
MSVWTPASEVLLRHSDDFERCRILFAGDLQDNLPAQLETAESRVWTQQYHHWQRLSAALGARAQFSFLADADCITGCDTLVYYWPKNKPEALFQLTNLLSLLPVGTDIFIVGENRSGVRSAEQMLALYAPLTKIDSARRCTLWHSQLETSPQFHPQDALKTYQVGDLTVKTLPGVFSRDGLDSGSQLLLSTLSPHTKGKVLDVGCGAGVLATALASHSPKVRLTLCDVSAPALEASRATLIANGIEGEVIASNVYSDVAGRFDMIISNPPFHEGRDTSLDATRDLICGATRHLNIGGELRIVANAFLPYPQLLDEIFGSHETIAQTGRFKVYRAVHQRSGRR